MKFILSSGTEFNAIKSLTLGKILGEWNTAVFSKTAGFFSETWIKMSLWGMKNNNMNAIERHLLLWIYLESKSRNFSLVEIQK